MSPQQLQQLPNRPIMRNRVGNGRDRLEPEHSLVIRSHDASTIRPIPPRILHIIMARRIRLPNIDLHVLHGLPVGIFHRADDEEGLAGGVVGNAGPRGKGLGVVRVEWAQHGAFGAVGGFGVVDGVDEDGEAEDIA